MGWRGGCHVVFLLSLSGRGRTDKIDLLPDTSSAFSLCFLRTPISVFSSAFKRWNSSTATTTTTLRPCFSIATGSARAELDQQAKSILGVPGRHGFHGIGPAQQIRSINFCSFSYKPQQAKRGLYPLSATIRFTENLTHSLAGIRSGMETDMTGSETDCPESSVMSIPTLRAKEMVMGCRPMPSLEFQFILVKARISLARWRMSVGPHEPISRGAGICRPGYSSHHGT